MRCEVKPGRSVLRDRRQSHRVVFPVRGDSIIFLVQRREIGMARQDIEDTVSQETQIQLRSLLISIYGSAIADNILPRIEALIEKTRSEARTNRSEWVDETDVVLITYGNSITEDDGRAPLEVLDSFLNQYAPDLISDVHILPCFAWTSDDGFSVSDYRTIDPSLGGWTDVERLAKKFGLMLDAVINHVSSQSLWFQRFIEGDPKYRNYFHVCDPTIDYGAVVRPRTSPLLTRIETKQGAQHVWTTFSEDQIDLNYSHPDVLIDILGLLLFYASKGARFIRLDAIGYLWKELGTGCIHLPETHAVIQVMRLVIDAATPGVMLITETNVPHQENISYFGSGTNEAHMVYQFPLPPLTLHSLQTGSGHQLSEWLDSLPPTSPQTTYFNFLSSHDGIGVRPVENILSREEVAKMARRVEENGGKVSARDLPGGETAPYELNISYLDAVAAPGDDDKTRAAKFLAAETILLSVVGMPGIYIHSLLGTQNDYDGLQRTGRNRSINRAKLDLHAITRALAEPESLRSLVFEGHRNLLAARRQRPAFCPNSMQRIVPLDDRVVSLVRAGGGDRVWAIINVSAQSVTLQTKCRDLGFQDDASLMNLISDIEAHVNSGQIALTLRGYSTAWFVEGEETHNE